MVLLSLIAVGLLSLSSVVLRSSGSSDAQMVAMANARMALQIAIGELQKNVGPDTRITANASIMEGRAPVANGNNHITGVWNAWRPNPNRVGDYDSRKEGTPSNNDNGSRPSTPDGGFYRWLVSSPNETDVTEVGYISQAPEEAVTLVSQVDNDIQSEVRAATLAVNADGESIGRYGWAVLDESQKAPLNVIAPTSSRFSDNASASARGPVATGVGGILQRMATQREPSWNNTEEWSNIGQAEPEDRAKLISSESLELISIPNSERFIHDLTPASQGLLTDVTRGGFKRDLSLLFQDENLPNSFTRSNTHIYSGSDTPLIGATNRANHPHLFPSPDPTWSLLHQYYRIPATMDSPTNPVIQFQKNSANSQNDSFPDRMVDLVTNPSYHNTLKLAPVISKAQFIFSMSFGTVNTLYQSNGNRGIWPNDTHPGAPNQPGNSPWKAAALMVLDPIITLWNPYDVPMDISPFYIYLYRLPLAFKFETSSTPQFYMPPEEAQEFARFGFARRNLEESGEPRPLGIPMEVLPPSGQDTMRLAPGEHVVFSAENSSDLWEYIGRNSARPDRIMRLRPKYNLPTSSQAPQTGLVIGSLVPDPNGSTLLNGGAFYRGVSRNPDRNGAVGIFRTPAVLMRENDTLRVSVEPSTESNGLFETVGGRSIDFLLRYGSWVNKEDRPFRRGEEQTHLPDFGAIEFNYNSGVESVFSNLDPEQEIPIFPIESDDVSHINSTIHQRKKPFLVASLNLKSLTQNENPFTATFPGKSWIHNNPNAIYASTATEQQSISLGAEQYEFSYAPLNGAWMNGVPEILPTADRDRGFGGPSPTPRFGRPFAPFASIPRELPTSLAQLRHAPLNQSGQHPLQAQVVANSYAHPLLEADRVIDAEEGYLDHSYLANTSLFDSTFLSSAIDSDDMTLFLEGSTQLRNSRFSADLSGRDIEDSEVWDPSDPDAYLRSGSLLTVDGMFNVNSTSVRAWSSLLSGFFGEEILEISSLDRPSLEELTKPIGNEVFSRFNVPIEESLGDNLDSSATADGGSAWKGRRQLTTDQIRDLAVAIVDEVKLRGPFQSLGEFINRRVEDSELGQKGALQAAIDNAGGNNDDGGLNQAALQSEGIELDSQSISDINGFENFAAAEGSTLDGTPGFLTQGDLLNSIAPLLTVRSDTFKIRTYGSATDNNGRVIAEAWSEAIVQRNLDFVDPTNSPSDFVDLEGDLTLSETNRRFGRAFRVVSFRWLTKDEVQDV